MYINKNQIMYYIMDSLRVSIKIFFILRNFYKLNNLKTSLVKVLRFKRIQRQFPVLSCALEWILLVL